MKSHTPTRVQKSDEAMKQPLAQTAHPEVPKKSQSLGLLAQVSTLAWNLVIPIVGGVLLGHYIDLRSGSELTWTLSLLVMGVFIAFSNLYNLYIEQGRVDSEQDQRKNDDEVTHVQEK